MRYTFGIFLWLKKIYIELRNCIYIIRYCLVYRCKIIYMLYIITYLCISQFHKNFKLLTFLVLFYFVTFILRMQGICFFPPIAQEYVFLVCECDPEQDVCTHPKNPRHTHISKGMAKTFQRGEGHPKGMCRGQEGEKTFMCVCVRVWLLVYLCYVNVFFDSNSL